MAHLVLAIEVLSPLIARLDLTIKRQPHIVRGAAEYSIVDLEARAFEVDTLGARIARVEHQQRAWQPSPTSFC